MAKVPINPDVLAWAIEEAGRRPDEVAAAAEVQQTVLESWLRGQDQPSVTQFRKLAGHLRRPTATFLLPAPPKSSLPSVEFRHAPDQNDRPLGAKERLSLREAARLQGGLRWVSKELGDEAVQLPKVRTTSDAEASATTVRRALDVSVRDQLAWKNEFTAFREWRLALERLGVVVLALPMGAASARGFSVWDDRVPVIAVNTHWGASARIFSLFHEVGHLASRTSSVCDESTERRHRADGDPVERWCEAFAAALLLPWPAVETFLRDKTGWDGRSTISDLRVASKLARKFKVSLRAAVLRLIDKGFARWALYGAIPPSSEAKTGGGGGDGGMSRYELRLHQYGTRTARVLLRGLERDVVTRDDVTGYLNIGDAELPSFGKLASQA